MNAYKIVVNNESRYASLFVVADNIAHARQMLDAWCADATKEEIAAIPDDDPADREYGYVLDNLRAVDPDDMSDVIFVTYQDNARGNITLADLAAEGPGVTMLKSGLNG